MSDHQSPPPFQITNEAGVVVRDPKVFVKDPQHEYFPEQAVVHAGWLLYRALSINPEIPVDRIFAAIQYRAGTGLARKISLGILREDPSHAL
jgi:hypothetical protein